MVLQDPTARGHVPPDIRVHHSKPSQKKKSGQSIDSDHGKKPCDPAVLEIGDEPAKHPNCAFPGVVKSPDFWLIGSYHRFRQYGTTICATSGNA